MSGKVTKGSRRSATANAARGDTPDATVHRCRDNGRTKTVALLTALVIAVALLVVATHWPALSAQAICFDDDMYLTENALVQNPGWTSAGRFIGEVFEPSTVQGYYQPLPMISLMLDYAAGGRADDLRAFHRTSLALHVINTGVVVIWLYLLFGHPGVAALGGLLFGVHPLTVGSIAWVAERKTVLATFFAVVGLLSHTAYARKGTRKFYGISLAAYALALLSKPTTVPLPGLMLLVDFWPLRRLNIRALVEKLPFFLLAALFAVITVVSQRTPPEVQAATGHSAVEAVLGLCYSIVFYLQKIVWPAGLSLHYLPPEPLAVSNPVVLVGIIGTLVWVFLLLLSLRWTRALLVGWLFFFGAMLPTSGMVAFTDVLVADRYAYLPVLGLLLPLTWFLCRLLKAARAPSRVWLVRVSIAVLGTALFVGEAVAGRRYLRHWSDSITLYREMLRIEPDDAVLHHFLAVCVQREGRIDEAFHHYREALRIRPAYPHVHFHMALLHNSLGELDEAIGHWRETARLRPDHFETHLNLGTLLYQRGGFHEAVTHWSKAAQLRPGHAEAHSKLAAALYASGKIDRAITECREAIRLQPNDAAMYRNLGLFLSVQGRRAEAVVAYREALRIDPDHGETQERLEAALAKVR